MARLGSSIHRSIVFAASLVPLICGSVQAQFDAIAAKVPATANAAALVDVERLLASPMAQKKGWAAKYDTAFAAGLVAIAPDTRRLVFAAEVNYEFMTPLWQMVVADLGQPRGVATIARATGGTLDPVADMPAVVLSDDSYCVQFAATQLGVISPANRQSVARWVREAAAATAPRLSPYLSSALVASKNSQIVMAFDLADAIPPDVIRAKLSQSAAVANKKLDLDAAAKVLASIRGMALEISVRDAANARLSLNFGEDAAVLKSVAKPLLIEVLSGMGARIDDMEAWQVSGESKRVVLTGSLSESGMKSVLSMVDAPTAALLAPASDTQTTEERLAKSQADASLAYFRSVSSLRDEMRDKSKDAQTFGQHALWFDNWARRIDRLPTLDVDEELLNYGRYVAQQMRNSSAALRGIGIDSATRSAQTWGSGYSYNTGWRDSDAERRSIRVQERGQGATTARAIGQEVEDQTAIIRQKMTAKYRVNF